MAEDDFDQLMDDFQVIYRMQAGDTVSQADVDALNRLDTYWRKNAEDAVAAHADGLEAGWRMAGGYEAAELLEKLVQSEIELSTQKAMRRFAEQNLRRAVLANVREEIRDEVKYALELSLTPNGSLTPVMLGSAVPTEDGSRHPSASDGEGEPQANPT